MMISAVTPVTDKYKWLALFAWFIFVWTWRSSDGAFLIGLTLICLWAWLAQAEKERYLASPSGIALSTALWCGALLLGSIWRTIDTQSFRSEEILPTLMWLSLLMFVPCGQLLYRHRSQLQWLLLLPVLAVVVRILSHISLDTWQSDLFGRGFYGFGLHHVRFGMQASLALIMLVALGPNLIRSLPKYRWVAIVLFLTAGMLIAQALFRCGSRSGIITLGIGIAVLLWRNRNILSQSLLNKRGALIAATLIAFLASTFIANYEQLHKRFVVGAYQQTTYTFSLQEYPRDKDVFLGRRLYLSAFGLEHWQSKPVFGHGPASAEILLDSDPDFKVHAQLHNMYVQTLLELGLSGVLAWLAISTSLLVGVIKSSKRIRQPHLLNYFWSVSIALAVWSVQSAAIYQASWRFVVVLVCSVAMLICYLGQEESQPANGDSKSKKAG